MNWQDAPAPKEIKDISPLGWIIAILRAVPLAIVVFGGLAIHLTCRLIERPFFGLNRPFTPFITQVVCRTAFLILGIKYKVKGTPMKEKGAVVANHSSWLDIFSLNACQRIYFVSKAEVAGWPGIGWLARATGTVFIRRDPKEAKVQKQMFEDRLKAGHKLLFFPEGTSTDAIRVLPFKSTLFAAFFDATLREHMHIQPVTVLYHAPTGEDPRYYGWWGEMDFGTHLLITLSTRRQGRVELVFQEPRAVEDFMSRKELAAMLEADIRAEHRLIQHTD